MNRNEALNYVASIAMDDAAPILAALPPETESAELAVISAILIMAGNLEAQRPGEGIKTLNHIAARLLATAPSLPKAAAACVQYIHDRKITD